jgi:hypothetical protein
MWGPPVIHRIHVAIAVEHGNRPTTSGYHLHSGALEVSKGAYVDPAFNSCLQSHVYVPFLKRDKMPTILS